MPQYITYNTVACIYTSALRGLHSYKVFVEISSSIHHDLLCCLWKFTTHCPYDNIFCVNIYIHNHVYIIVLLTKGTMCCYEVATYST